MSKQIKPYHRIWNDHNPNNRIEKGDGNVIHHKDENPKNNSIKNLKKMTDKEHRTLHHKGKKVSQETRNKISKIQKESSHFHLYNLTEEHKQKVIASNKKRIVTKQTKKKISDSLKGFKHSRETKEKMSKTHTGMIYSESHREAISLGKLRV